MKKNAFFFPKKKIFFELDLIKNVLKKMKKKF